MLTKTPGKTRGRVFADTLLFMNEFSVSVQFFLISVIVRGYEKEGLIFL